MNKAAPRLAACTGGSRQEPAQRSALQEARHFLRYATAIYGSTTLLQSAAASHPLLALCCEPKAAAKAELAGRWVPVGRTRPHVTWPHVTWPHVTWPHA
jgi:hypothetical protein